MPTVTLPAIGTVDRKWVLAGAAATAGIVAYAWIRHRNASASAASSTVDPNAIDPATGLPYSAENQPGTGYVNPVPTTTQSTIDTTGGTTPTTNEQWAQAVTEALGGIYDAQYLAETLGKYLAGQGLSAAEAVVIRTAWGLVGHPPVDKKIILTTGGSTPGTPPPQLAAPKNFKQVQASKNNVLVMWDGVAGASKYRVYGMDGALRVEGIGTTTYINGLAPNTTYGYYVVAVDSAGKESPHSASLSVHTSK